MQLTSNLIEKDVKKIGHVLLISPLTFSYHLKISETLNSLGYDVTWWNQSASNLTAYKILLRLFPTMMARFSEHLFRKKLYKLDSKSITHVLVIKGEALSKQIALEIKETLASASMGLYLWDGAKNVKGVWKILPIFDSIATFDSVDAKSYNWSYRPLFGNNIFSRKSIDASLQFDWCFIGTVHSDRHRVIHKFRRRYELQMKSFVFCYFQSPLILFLRRLLDWTLMLAPNGSLSTKPMTTTEVSKVILRSRAVLDIEHPLQHGLTMRSIETLMMGKKLITTNRHILTSNLYDPSRVFVITRDDPEIPLTFLDQPFKAVSNTLRNYYSCRGWLLELLELQNKARRVRCDK